MKYIIDFFKKEKNFFKGSVFLLISSYILLIVNNIFDNYDIITRDRSIIILLIGFSVNFFAIGFNFFRGDFKRDKEK